MGSLVLLSDSKRKRRDHGLLFQKVTHSIEANTLLRRFRVIRCSFMLQGVSGGRHCPRGWLPYKHFVSSSCWGTSWGWTSWEVERELLNSLYESAGGPPPPPPPIGRHWSGTVEHSFVLSPKTGLPECLYTPVLWRCRNNHSKSRETSTNYGINKDSMNHDLSGCKWIFRYVEMRRAMFKITIQWPRPALEVEHGPFESVQRA